VNGELKRGARAAIGVLALLVSQPLAAQGIGPSTGGTIALRHAERMLGHTKRVLLVAAHPDDEDTELLTVLVRGQGAEAAYLSLSRGEGGQNLIGAELGEELGLIRTGELLAARELDGARQYFTRAFDFGFSKTIEETERFWPRDSVLKDVVRIIRRFRPQIVVATFSGTPRDGHGQHQMAGWAAREGFRVAGDPARFAELEREEGLAPWQPLKLYQNARFAPGGGGVSVTLDGGQLDPEVGQSYRQVAMRSRSLHRSQDMGVLQEVGPSTVRLALVEDRTGSSATASLWAGIDTSAAPLDGPGIASADQRRHAASAAAIRAGIIVDATTRDGRLVPGQRIPVRLTLWNTGPVAVDAELRLDATEGWRIGGCEPAPRSVAAGEVATCDALVDVPADAPLSTPYFLREPRADGMYRWSGAPAWWGEPYEPAPLTARFRISPAGAGAFELTREAVHRYRDQAVGEVRRPLAVVPRVDLKLEPATTVWPLGSRAPRPFQVTVQHGAGDPTAGTVELELPPGWPPVPAQRFTLSREEEREVLTFAVRLGSGAPAGRYPIRAVARDSTGRRFSAGAFAVDYPHIRPVLRARPAESAVALAPIALPAVTRVGYVRGASDRVPEALLGVGLPLDLLDAAALERAELSRYDVIVIGSRAYEVEPALRENNARLLEYVRAGGRLLVQYQQQIFFSPAAGYAPASMTVGQPHDRVTDEAAPVTILEPAHPAFLHPNRIGAADWNGWVQERGLYFARSWDPRYRPLLELADPGAAPLRGGLLVLPHGRGTYIYTGLSFFRQLPAGVPGAFRLFLNLLELRAPLPRP
jgi:LmbE family N-acetylglucosaminyl deacetylase